MSRFAAYEPSPEPRPDPAGASLRPAGESDIAELAALQMTLHGQVARWTERIAAPARDATGGDATGGDSAVVLARVAGALTGYARVAYLTEHSDGAPAGYYLAGVSVAPRWRRRGIGDALTRWRMDWVRARGGPCFCFVSAANPASLDLHLRLGFEQVRRGPSFQGVTFDCGEGILLRRR